MADEWNARFWLGIYGFEAERTAQGTHAIASDDNAVIALQDEDQLQDAVLRMIRILLVERRENAQVLGGRGRGTRIQRRAGEAEKLRLSRERNVFVIPIDEQLAIPRAMGKIFFGAKRAPLRERRRDGEARRALLSMMQLFLIHCWFCQRARGNG